MEFVQSITGNYLSFPGGAQPPSVRIDPRTQIVNVGEVVEFRCIASGSPEPKLVWGREDGELMNPEATFGNGVTIATYPKSRFRNGVTITTNEGQTRAYSLFHIP